MRATRQSPAFARQNVKHHPAWRAIDRLGWVKVNSEWAIRRTARAAANFRYRPREGSVLPRDISAASSHGIHEARIGESFFADR